MTRMTRPGFNPGMGACRYTKSTPCMHKGSRYTGAPQVQRHTCIYLLNSLNKFCDLQLSGVAYRSSCFSSRLYPVHISESNQLRYRISNHHSVTCGSGQYAILILSHNNSINYNNVSKICM